MIIRLSSSKWSFDSARVIAIGFAGPLSLTEFSLYNGIIAGVPISEPRTINLDLMALTVTDLATGNKELVQTCQGISGLCTENDIRNKECLIQVDGHSLLRIRARGENDSPLPDIAINLVTVGATYILQSDKEGLCRAMCRHQECWVAIKGDIKSIVSLNLGPEPGSIDINLKKTSADKP